MTRPPRRAPRAQGARERSDAVAQGARRRGDVAAADLSGRVGRDMTRPESTVRRVKKTGRLRERTAPRTAPSDRVEGIARNKDVVLALRDVLPKIPSEHLGGANPGEVLGRLELFLGRVELEKYSTEHLLRSRGMRWAWFGGVWEEIIASMRALWGELAGYARMELQDLNEILSAKKGRGLLNGAGTPISELEAGPPGPFPGNLELATEVRLVPKGGSPADKGTQYTDRMFVSFQGPRGPGQWMANPLNAEIKVPKQKTKLSGQTAEAIPRLLDASYIKMTIVDGSGRTLRYETIAVERMVINPSSTNRFGIAGRGGKMERIDFVSGHARGFKETHIRYELPISTEGAQKIIDTIFSRRALARKRP